MNGAVINVFAGMYVPEHRFRFAALPAFAANGDQVLIGKPGALQSDRAYDVSVGQPGLARLAACTVSRT